MRMEKAKKTIYTEAMEIFEHAADLIGLDPRVRLELEEPDYEHIFYVTVKLRERLVPLSKDDQKKYVDLARFARHRRARAALRRPLHHPRQGAPAQRRHRARRRDPPRRQRPLPPRAGAGAPLQGLPRPAQPGARPVQGRHPLPPRGLARPLQVAGRGDDLEDGHRRHPFRRRQGRHQARPAPLLQGGAGAHHPALHVPAQGSGRPRAATSRRPTSAPIRRSWPGCSASTPTASARGTTCAAWSPARTSASAAAKGA